MPRATVAGEDEKWKMHMNRLLTKCPVCGQALSVTRLHCESCGTTIEGAFSVANGPFAQLTPDQAQFLLTFVRCEGRFNRMEDELKVSYPTLRNRLQDVIRALGFDPGREDAPIRLTAEERRRILEDLDQGKITPEQASRLLKGLEA
jgi:hypothetical protein